MDSILINFDGCCEPKNPGGHAGWGAAVDFRDEKIDLSGYCGSGPAMSNNVAEYSALIGAVEYIKTRPEWSKIPLRIVGDSALVVCQMARSIDTPNLRRACYPDGCGKKARKNTPEFPCWGLPETRGLGCTCHIPPPPWTRNQLENGGKGPKETLYYALMMKADKLLAGLQNPWTIEWTSRDFNGRADELSKRILLDRGILFKIQPTS